MSSDKSQKIKEQIEYYLSDNNLRHDKIFHELISSTPDGYIPWENIFKCKKIKDLEVEISDVVAALRASSEAEADEKLGVRRSGNRALPPLQATKQKKAKLPEPVTAILSISLPEETKTTWKDLRDAFRAKFVEVDATYVRLSGHEGHIGISGKTPNEKVHQMETEGFDVKGAHAAVKKLEGDELLEFWKENGSHFDQCNNSNKKRKVEKSRKGLNIGGKFFGSVTKLKDYLKSLLNSSPEGKPVDPQYHTLLESLLKLHPEFESKSVGLKTFSVDKHPSHPESKCFFIIREDGSQEDFSVTKCLEQL